MAHPGNKDGDKKEHNDLSLCKDEGEMECREMANSRNEDEVTYVSAKH